MTSFFQKATPFFEHIVIGIAFGWLGYVFFWTFNTSNIFSILGMAAVCFGGLKILIGIIIYGAWIFALIFRPEYLKQKELEEQEELVKKAAAAGETAVHTNWMQANIPFVAKHWGTMLELSILITGLLIIVITKNGV